MHRDLDLSVRKVAILASSLIEVVNWDAAFPAPTLIIRIMLTKHTHIRVHAPPGASSASGRTTALSFALWLRKTSHWKASAIGALLRVLRESDFSINAQRIPVHGVMAPLKNRWGLLEMFVSTIRNWFVPARFVAMGTH